MARSLRVLVAGGGIGGLTAALALQRRGVEALVLERAPAMREIGAGLTLWSNALRALARLGLDGRVRAAGWELASGDVVTAGGRLLFHADVAEMSRAVGSPTYAIARAALQRVLLGALPDGTLRLGAAVRAFREEADGVVALLEDGREERGDALVGADGVSSAVRRQLHGEEALRYAGYTCWRAILTLPGPWSPAHGAREAWGRGLRFGAVPLGERLLYWFASKDAPPGEPFDAEADLARLRGLARGWASPVPEVLAALPPQAMLRHDIHDRPPLATWGRGRVTLLGDAAHPMTPNLGQGACAAVEDALVLADRLTETSDVQAALCAYEAERRPRTARLVRKARFLGRVGQERSRPLAAIRNVLMRLRPASAYRREMRSFVDYDTKCPAGEAGRPAG